MEIKQIPSPNITKGRKGNKPLAIVIHIMEGTLVGTDSWFKNPASSVSAHYGIGKDGTVHQYVQEADSAWHAGRVNAPSWKLIKPAGSGSYVNPNYYTIGIEHEGNEQSEWTDAMYAASAEMIKGIAARWGMPIDRDHIIGHHEIYSLKTCPGFKVDLNKLVAMAGGVQQPDLSGEPVKVVQAGTATTTARLNIRKSPDTKFAPVNTINARLPVTYAGYTTEGELVQGNGKWFFMSDGNWFWSGGVK